MAKPRARDLGIRFEGIPGPLNAITDIPGIEVGYATLHQGSSIRTGLTIIHPRGKRNHDPVFAGWFPFNGNGEMTGSAWVDEGGFLEGPIGITNTHSVGVVRDTIIQWQVEHSRIFQGWSTPLVTETADGWLNDINAFFVKPEHILQALRTAKLGPIEEGNVGGGTGMLCYEFKGGTGTSSRKLPETLGGWTIGALAQTNFGRRFQLTIAGVPVGKHLKENSIWGGGESPFKQDDGSLIVVLATDAPMTHRQLTRLATRATHGLTRTGSISGNTSGDFAIAFSTTRKRPHYAPANTLTLDQVVESTDLISLLFGAVVEATEEAVLNSLFKAETMTGRDNRTVYELPIEETVKIMNKYGHHEVHLP